ncbi:acyl-CoA-binding domain-containing protein 4-like [Dioscorea cayenensis subsp. rotundata]|uniref:Acyl-CoA-binding domain-containing protein 4-like n=1 Tax=Dioscorea cayennensis subsp. rotundata TaxID=55577 RepID=A0AB40C5I2_DIOCR|nr:acyl-CoA-binding domain-containing protein 4-like [Dioscorea cayenensis subsp. rotundata]
MEQLDAFVTCRFLVDGKKPKESYVSTGVGGWVGLCVGRKGRRECGVGKATSQMTTSYTTKHPLGARPRLDTMASLGLEEMKRRKAMWFGYCIGLHFNDVLTLNLDTMVWKSLVTTGPKPGNRDSHSTTLVGHRMVVLGGTNGSKKVNDIHILDLKTMEWSKSNSKCMPPSPRESHTITVVGDEKLVIFGGSGEGKTRYLNDIHILDLKSMSWSSPDVKGELPAPRDSHIVVSMGNKLIIYGGDCGDCYHGEVDVLDMENMT